MDRKNELLVRVYLVLIIFIGIAGLIGWRIFSISVLEGAKWKEEISQKNLKWRPVKAQRGDIYGDEGERLLASSIEFFEIRMDPVSPSDQAFDEGIDELCAGLQRILGEKSATAWKKSLAGARNAYKRSQKSGSRNILISRKANDETLRQLRELPLFKLGKIKGGLIVNRFYSRKKTYHEMAARTIGEYREKNMVGIENSYDQVLKGAERKELMRFVPPDLWIPLYDPTDFEMIRGKDVVTTLDIDIQDVAHHELQQGVIQNKAEAGVLIIMDVKTGYIKAMSNLNCKDGQCREIENRAVTTRSEPGSTIKAATVLALLETGMTIDKKVRIDNGKKKFYDLWMYDSNYPHDDKFSDLRESFIKSSNVGIASLAMEQFNSKEGRKNYYNLLSQFGIVEKTGIDLIGEPVPYIKHPVKDAGIWSGVTVPWMAHGYELQVTPLQTLAFYNAIANDGVYMQPRLVKEIRDGERVLRTLEPNVKKKRIADPQNIEVVQQLMQEVVTRGTGKNIYTDDYAIAGKTGTATFNYTGDREKGYNASFAGYFPADDPKYSMIAVVYGIKGKRYYGSQVAGPIFRNVADRIMILEGGISTSFALADDIDLPDKGKGFGYDFKELYEGLGHDVITKIPRWAEIENEGSQTIASRADIKKNKVPNVRGMGLRDAMYVLENLGMEVEVHGSGKVYKQSRKPGANIDKSKIEIYLN